MDSDKENVRIAPPRKQLGVRHLQATLMALCCLVAYALRANLSVAIVAMVPPPSNSTEERIGPKSESSLPSLITLTSSLQVFPWDEKTTGLLLGAFFWGYMLCQIPGGLLAQRLGGSRLLAGALFVTAAATLLLPLSAEYGGWMAVFANRVVQGLSQAPIFPSIYNLLGVWMPPTERDMIATCILAFQMLGTVIANPLCGFMAAQWGWPSIFYSFGMVGVATGTAILHLGADRPALHRSISPEELAFIETSMNAAEPNEVRPETPPTPWKDVLSSVPVWMVWITMSVQDMAYFTFLGTIPSYLAKVLNIPLEENGLLSSLPYLTGFVTCLGFTAATTVVQKRLSTTNTRKLFNLIASVGISVSVVLMGYVSSITASVTLMCLSMGFMSATFVAVQTNALDMAPLHAGPIYAVGNTMAAVLGALGPYLVGFVVTESVRQIPQRL
ncbi:hypothetical protein ONE63_003430 [Megalurothrips usitatus]|uniref:Major facilitator superfamily (MFS) profile domain-containing protein n=1 Tax=Megalurothrips usitatus TaxID=439358 RepID=A0AAV7X9M8_9NEOP|nr:hypothetical protein ONE63_003430 [Megalurothrips usitatus]